MFNNNEMNEFGFSTDYETTMQQNVKKTFLWMTLGVLLTGAIAAICAASPAFYLMMYNNSMIPLVLLIVQLGIAVSLSARLFKMKVTTTKVLYLAYAGILGLTLSSIALSFTSSSIALAFVLSAGYFVALSVIGYTTKINLMRMGPILYIGLLFLVISEIVLMFMGVDTMTMGFTAVGLALFTGITAYDIQKMKKMYMQFQGDEEMMQRLSIYNAFQLYLDFVNIFLYILRIVAKEK